MGKPKLKAVDGGGMKGPKMNQDRIFMANGSVFTVGYVSKELVPTENEDYMEYKGVDGLFLGSVNMAHVATLVSADVPVDVQTIPGTPATGGQPTQRQVLPKGGFIVQGYNLRQ